MDHARIEDRQRNKIRGSKDQEPQTEGEHQTQKDDLMGFSPSFSNALQTLYRLRPRTRYTSLCGFHHYDELSKVLKILLLDQRKDLTSKFRKYYPQINTCLFTNKVKEMSAYGGIFYFERQSH